MFVKKKSSVKGSGSISAPSSSKLIVPSVSSQSQSQASTMVASANEIQINQLPVTVKATEQRSSAVGSRFKQQKLSAWKPVLEPGVASPTLLVLAIICFTTGFAIHKFSEDLHEKIIPYTDCTSSTSDSNTSTSITCAQQISQDDGPATCFCRVPFSITDELKGRIFMYYELTNFYQNHRQYVKSSDDVQLYGGSDDSDSSAAKNCKQSYESEGGKIYWPCGANARSMFQDVIRLFQNDSTPINLKRTGIAWATDKNHKYKNPDDWNSNTFKDTHASPETWVRDSWHLDPDDADNNGLQNEDLIVWMRIAAFPKFRKLYRIFEDDTLPKGDYYLDIEYSFPVNEFSGTKSIVISNTSILGGKNPYLGLCFIVVGAACLLTGLFFLGVHYMIKRMPEPSIDSDNEDQRLSVPI